MAAGESWSPFENEVIVSAYLDMLDRELRGEPFVKSKVNEDVRQKIGRSRGSVEYKFQNVSAVLIELSHPYVRGYKAASNFQESLRDSVVAQVQARTDLRTAALDDFTREPTPHPDFAWNLTDAPSVEFSPHRDFLRRATKVDFVQVDAANRSLGLAGERAVVELERTRLQQAGLDSLARQVRHASQDEGDGLGYDIRSFDLSGEEKFVEVKTTRRGPQWPMLISRNEVQFSQEESARFHLYRVFDFDQPIRGLYELPGSITQSCTLRPAVYEALPA
ncbi:hypothetical protein GCM10022415_33980 [Knoellia locipacati]|uniref:Protein NO VEIN C-terminal domain-containing protein n=1 Tax=Knoellia locipacati TaxID=882824 RepID=A0A512T543_9MICO|nr:DUF3883 domain-containing protein [Knoellia locipacati]GEQ15344.1 hypothetical protein KLO01_33910 [Knoellia locipacati]